ncbi:MAG: ABC-F family ATP-binding cassette domain-containing protein, partial [Limisphaerales bacterium]
MAALPHHTMLLSSTDLSLAYDYLRLLDKVSVAVRSGEKVGLVGRNGCGKSSLLKILAGEALPDSGECSARKGLRIGYLPQSFELKEELTVRDNILDGASDVQSWIREYESGEGSEDRQVALMEKINLADGWKLNSRVDAVGSFLTVPDMNSLVRPLSGGEKRRVALARSLVAQPDLLLLDEPTNHLDTEAIQWLESYIAQFPGAVIFTTHDRYFLDHLATRVVELDEGKAYSHEGNYASYLENKAIRDTIADQGERRRQRFLRVELDWVRAGVRARRTKSRHRLDTFYQTKEQSAPVDDQ